MGTHINTRRERLLNLGQHGLLDPRRIDLCLGRSNCQSVRVAADLLKTGFNDNLFLRVHGKAPAKADNDRAQGTAKVRGDQNAACRRLALQQFNNIFLTLVGESLGFGQKSGQLVNLSDSIVRKGGV